MAIIKTTPATCQFFVSEDPYNYITDNRPLGHLLNNDLIINAELESVRDEVIAARDSAIKSIVYQTLDHRLEDIESGIGNVVQTQDIEDIRDHTYGSGLMNAYSLRRTCPSGWLDFGGIADLAVGDSFDDFAGFRTTTSLNSLSPGDYSNTIVLWAGWGAAAWMPIRAVVNGWIIELYHETLGSPAMVLAGHLNLHLNSAPTTDKETNFLFLEVWLEETSLFTPFGADDYTSPSPTSDPLNDDVVRTVLGMSTDGDWVQIRHRIRIVSDINPDTAPKGYGPNVYAWGSLQANESHQYTFINTFAAGDPGELNRQDDGGLWRSGNGTQQSKDDLGSYDGYVYSIPIALIHRRNTGDWTITNQNGSRKPSVTSGYISSGVSGRPDGLFYDQVDQRDILDLRHRVSLTGFNMEAELHRTWEMLARGELKTQWNEVEYDHDNDKIWDSVRTWGHTLLQIDQISNSPEQYIHTVRDRQVPGEPVCAPDGVRNVWSKTPQLVKVKFGFTAGTAVSAYPASFVTYDVVGAKLTLNTAGLDGGSGTKLGTTPPVIIRKSDMSTLGNRRIDTGKTQTKGLGSGVSIIKMEGLIPSEDYVGFVYVLYPGGSGLTFPQKRILESEVWDNGTTLFDDAQFGLERQPGSTNDRLKTPAGVIKSSSGFYYVVDKFNYRIVKLDNDMNYVSQFGETGVSGSDNSHLREPNGIALARVSEDVIVCDTLNHRVIRLDSNLNYISQFGVTGTSGADNTHCNEPTWCDANVTEIYFSDRKNHRLVRLNTSMGYVAQFGSTNKPGSGLLGLNEPTGVALTTSGFGNGIWIADYKNERIVVLERTNLVHKYEIGPRARNNTLSVGPIVDVIQDSVGNLYISRPDHSTVSKYSPELALISQFGTPWSRGEGTKLLDWPLGMCIDEAGGYLYVADRGNDRIVRLSTSNLSYVSQYGADKVMNSSVNSCPNPTDVCRDIAGNFYITNTIVSTVTKVAPDFSTRLARFGQYGVTGPSRSTSRLYWPQGIATNESGTRVLVADTRNARVVVLKGSNLSFIRYFHPEYDQTQINRVVQYVADVEYDPNYGSGLGRWLVSTKEHPPQSEPDIALHWAVMRFTEKPPVATPNYIERFEAHRWPMGLHFTPTHILTATNDLGVGFYDKSNPDNDFYFTSDPRLGIEFSFYDLQGDLQSDGDRVLVSEPLLNVVHLFDADAAIHRGTAGVIGEAGNDKTSLYRPHSAYLDGEEMVISDTLNHRVLRRHVSTPWISETGIINTMVPPVGADKIRIMYESDAYQGMFRYRTYSGITHGSWSIYKSHVVAESQFLYVTTLGLGRPMSWRLHPFQHLRGLTSRLPLPKGFKDYELRPTGMKLGHTGIDRAGGIGIDKDDGPYLIVPIIYTEGLMGGQIDVSTGVAAEEGWSHLRSQQSLQQILRTKGNIEGSQNPLNRGFRSWLPRDLAKWTRPTFYSHITRFDVKPHIAQQFRKRQQWAKKTETFSQSIRQGVPRIAGIPLQRAVPHFTYMPFLFVSKGELLMGVISEATKSAAVSIGTDAGYSHNAVDGFYPYGRILVRR